MSRSWDVFCRVIDNYGDAAVCWRLARQLAGEHGGRVRLWIDALPALHALCPEVGEALLRQTVERVEVCAWSDDAQFGAPADIVIEAFGCGLPGPYVQSMIESKPRPVWIILEYLSAEPWVVTHHGLPSPHPRLPLERHFFLPGFVPGTGGVLRESSLEPRRMAFENAPDARADFWKRAGFGAPSAQALVVSLFGYENPAVRGFLLAWAQGTSTVVLAVPQSRLRAEVCDFFSAGDLGDGATLVKGRLEVRLLPFMPQPAYDELLWACDWNFVRGEDSFVRAQWARRPLVWQIYPQAERAHEVKLEAFLDHYCAGLDARLAGPLRRVWQAWNRPPNVPPAVREDWAILAESTQALRRHAGDWAAKLALPGELALNLAQYCEERLK